MLHMWRPARFRVKFMSRPSCCKQVSKCFPPLDGCPGMSVGSTLRLQAVDPRAELVSPAVLLKTSDGRSIEPISGAIWGGRSGMVQQV